MEMREKFLPIGSVVLLKGGTKKAMITGFCSIAAEDKAKIYDYSGCIYPEGYLNSNQICLFDHDQIEEIFFIGYEDDEEKEFKISLNDVIKDYHSGELNLTDDMSDEDIDNDNGSEELVSLSLGDYEENSLDDDDNISLEHL